MPATLFTTENAAEMGRKGGLTTAEREKQRKEQAEADKKALLALTLEPEITAMKSRVLRQIEACDALIDDCSNPDMFVKLTAAKDRLWNLIMPKAGVLRPRQNRQSRPVPVATEAPAAPQPVVSCGVQPKPEPNITAAEPRPVIPKD